MLSLRTSMSRCFTGFALALALLSGCVQSSPSGERTIRLAGTLSLEVFAGRPNYESVAAGDEAEEVWILTAKEKYQLVVIDTTGKILPMLHRCLGKQIVVEGVVWPAENGHHHTDSLITVRTIREKPLGRNDQGRSPPAATAGSRP